MTDEIDFASAFEGMEPSQVKELTTRIKDAVRREIDTFKQPQQPEGDPYAAQEEAEIEVLRQRGVTGMNFATSRAVIREKYSALRNQPEPVVDPEIEATKGDPDKLMQLYRQRRAKIESRKDLPTVTKLRLNSELEATFRKAGQK